MRSGPRGQSENTVRPTFWPLGMRPWREFGEGLEIRVIQGELLLRRGQHKNGTCATELTLILAQVSAFQIT